MESIVKTYKGIIFEISPKRDGFKVFKGSQEKFVALTGFSKWPLIDKIDQVKDYIDEIPSYGL